MKFSIILPCYNVEKYIRACIDSILQQTYKDFEVILVDDGARDSTPQICDEYAEKDARVRTIHKPNGGQAELLADKTAGNPDIVHYKFQEWFESDGHIAPCRFDYRIPTKGRSVADIYCDLIDKDAYYNSAWSKIIRRGLLMENEIRFEKGIVGEDNEWYYHVVMAAKSLALVDEPLYIYRRRQGSTTTAITRKNLVDQLHVLDKWEKILQTKATDSRTSVVRSSLAKQYCSALIIYAGLKDVSDLYPELKRKSHMLRYSRNKRVIVFRRMKRLLGIKGVIVALKTAKRLR